jgi:DNA replication protein DnaC
MLALLTEALAREGLSLPLEAVERYSIELRGYVEHKALCAACTDPADCTALAKRYEPVLRARGVEIDVLYRECARAIAARRAKARDELFSASRMPRRLRRMTFGSFEAYPANEVALARATAALDNERWLLLAGPPGVGKTHLAAAILNARLERGRDGAFCTVPELLENIRQVMRTDSGSSGLIELVKTVELLILDDLGTEKVTDWVAEQLFVIVNARNLNERQTVVTTNYEAPQGLITHLGGITGERIVSRLLEAGDWVCMAGPDWRLKSP